MCVSACGIGFVVVWGLCGVWEEGGWCVVVVEIALLLDCRCDPSLHNNRVLLKSRALYAQVVAEKVEAKTICFST